MSTIIQRLRGGDRRSIGQANAIVRRVLAEPALLSQIIEGLRSDDPIVRMRCADVAEKLSAQEPDWLAPYKRSLLALAKKTTQQEVRWHLAQMLPRLDLTRTQRKSVVRMFTAYLRDESRIVQTFALQGLYDLSAPDPALRKEVRAIIGAHVESGSAAVRTRARRLIAELKRRRALRRVSKLRKP